LNPAKFKTATFNELSFDHLLKSIIFSVV
jgi:hypothetical protein